MPNLLHRAASPIAQASLVSLLLFAVFAAPHASAQTAQPESPLWKQLDRVDLGVSAASMFSNTASGIEQRDRTPLTLHPSSTVGELVTLRYTAKPYVGLEFNFSNSRYTENFTSAQNYLPGGVQTRIREFDFGYIAHLKWKPYGIQPFAGAGAGTMQFKPTTFGGQGLPEQYRMVYYYTAGLEDNFPGSHFGMRIAFRQLIYLGPDYLENYLIMRKYLRTTDPTVGFFVRF
jgi:hypothetical protein